MYDEISSKSIGVKPYDLVGFLCERIACTRQRFNEMTAVVISLEQDSVLWEMLNVVVIYFSKRFGYRCIIILYFC